VIAADQNIAPKVGYEEAISLAYKTYGVTKDEAFFDPLNGFSAPPFYIFEACSVPNDGCSGWIAINAWTGDAWDDWSCKPLSSKSLDRAKAQIRKRFTTTELKQYSKLSRMKPGCMGY